MAKKYLLMLGLLGLVSTAAIAQKNDAAADYWKDSSKVATKNMPQYNEFANNQYVYPAKPRNQWELGFHAGYAAIGGDVDARPGFGGGLSLRKSLGHVFSIRGDYTGSFSYGLDYRARTAQNAAEQAVWGSGQYVANYRAKTHQGNLDLIASLNSLSHYRGNPKTDWYLFAGYSLVASDVDIDPSTRADASANAASVISRINSGNLTKRKDIKTALKDLMNDYTVNAPEPNGSRDAIGRLDDNTLLRHAMSFGAGVSFKLSQKLSLGIEQRFTLPFSDDMDGVRSGNSDDFFTYTALRGGFTLGNSAKRVAPLWWTNPNNFIYNELNTPQHMKIPQPNLADADGDGVTDQFDLEPNTPAGAKVDARGRAVDTDGDGVPDYKDKEPLTPQNCFPVNADGVGTCPEPACCKELRDLIAKQPVVSNACQIGGLPSIQFAAGKATLGKDATALLNSAAQQIKANPNCNIKVIGYGATDKRAQQLSWDRVNAVIKYLVEKQGISEGRLIFTYGEMGGANTVDLQGTTENGPNTVPAPFPNYRK